MRVTSVGLYSNNVEAVSFSLRASEEDYRYMVRNIVGLDADELVPKFYSFGLATKARFYDFGLKAREIVMRIVLNPRLRMDESYSDIRDDLYRAISSTRTGLIALHFNSGATTVSRIFGFITKFEAAYFTKLPEVQITVRCDDPMFRGINYSALKTAALGTSSDVIIPDSLSTAPHGFSMKVTFKATSPAFTIQDIQTTPEWKFKVIPSGGFLAGDQLFFSSEYTDKYLYIMRGATRTDLMDKIEPTSVWPILFPGSNRLYFVERTTFDFNSFIFYPAYWGV